MPEDLTTEELAHAKKEWSETFWLERGFWDWYNARRPKKEPETKKKSYGSLLSEGWGG